MGNFPLCVHGSRERWLKLRLKRIFKSFEHLSGSSCLKNILSFTDIQIIVHVIKYGSVHMHLCSVDYTVCKSICNSQGCCHMRSSAEHVTAGKHLHSRSTVWVCVCVCLCHLHSITALCDILLVQRTFRIFFMSYIFEK